MDGRNGDLGIFKRRSIAEKLLLKNASTIKPITLVFLLMTVLQMKQNIKEKWTTLVQVI